MEMRREKGKRRSGRMVEERREGRREGRGKRRRVLKLTWCRQSSESTKMVSFCSLRSLLSKKTEAARRRSRKVHLMVAVRAH